MRGEPGGAAGWGVRLDRRSEFRLEATVVRRLALLARVAGGPRLGRSPRRRQALPRARDMVLHPRNGLELDLKRGRDPSQPLRHQTTTWSSALRCAWWRRLGRTNRSAPPMLPFDESGSGDLARGSPQVGRSRRADGHTARENIGGIRGDPRTPTPTREESVGSVVRGRTTRVVPPAAVGPGRGGASDGALRARARSSAERPSH
jgi:hypothetical protein